MKWFANLKISKKLLLGFTVVVVMAMAIGVVGVKNIQSIQANGRQMYEHMTVPIGQMAEVATSFQRVRVNLREIILLTSAQEISDCEAKIAERQAEINQNADAFEKLILSEEIRSAYGEFVKARDSFTGYMDQVVALARDNKDVQAFSLLQSAECFAAEMAEQDAILALVNLKRVAAEQKADENDSTADIAFMTMLGVIAAGLVLAVLIALYISRVISGSLRKITAVAERIADGDLDVDIGIDTRDEIGTLASAFHRMTGNLNEVLGGINAASEQVSSGAKQLADSSMSLSQGASEQASSIEELTASLEEIASQTKLNAQSASQANKLAGMAQGNAEQGNGQMQEMLRAMEDINQSSASISKIIKVIDDIAFQTNILALNAAVEAARAGQHGKGFAVVAEEVRNLAAKSASAAKETTEMIEGSIRKVEAGTKLAVHTAGALNQIVSGVAEAAALVKQIDVASSEQATGLAQINQAVMQVSQVVQANSAVSEQSAAASKELSGQADMMRQSVGKFRLKRGFAAHKASIPVEEPVRSAPKQPREERPNRAPGRPVIALSDEEFGKY
jgi:methyl-accepting chemotaxis protein